jgi:hypothetical protein
MPCPGNDAPDGAIDVSAGGTFTADLTAAHDDQDVPGCGMSGGRDVFYTMTLAAPEAVYLDTFGSGFDTIVRIFAGGCSAMGALQSCLDDACSVKQSQGAMSLAAGTYCVVADQYSSGAANGALTLNIVRGGRTGTPLPVGGSTSGSSCTATNWTTAGCQPTSSAEDAAFYFTLCPAQTRTVNANTCTGTGFDSVLYLRKAGFTTDLACNDDKSGCGSGAQSALGPTNVTGPGMFWLTVDGFNNQCGAFTLSYTVN